MDLFSTGIEEDKNGSNHNLSQLNFREDKKPSSKPKENKYSAKEIIFNI